MWRIFIKSPLDPPQKKVSRPRGKISTNMKEYLKEAILEPPIIVRRNKLGTLNRENQNLVDLKSLKGADMGAPNIRKKWATRITSLEIPTGITMNHIGKWTSA